MNEKHRSHWGWGWADRFPGPEAREQLAQMVEAMLGLRGLRPTEPVDISAVGLPAPRVRATGLLEPFATTDDEDRIRHTYGRAYLDLLRGFRGEFDTAPDVVAYPRSEEQILQTFSWAAREGAAVIPYGGGTSVVGGVEARGLEQARPVISLDMKHFTGLYELDETSRLARIGAGTLGPALEESLAPHGLTLRHFPQSFEFSTLGGWLATRAGGHYATVYTHIDDLTESIRMLTPSGVLETPRVPASGAGPCPNRLILGSEGILGVITEAWMRVRPRPRYRSRANVLFKDFSQAVEATRNIAQAYLHPSNCRLLDSREAMLNGVVQDGSHVLLLGFESASAPSKDLMESALAIATAAGGRCPEGATHVDEEARTTIRDASQRWRQAFLDAPYLQNNLISLGVMADTFETACTWDRFEDMHRAIVGEVREAMKTGEHKGWISCRFTHVYPDGPAPYYTFIAKARPGEEVEQWWAIKNAASNVLRRFGATITHHHAVGRTHRAWYDEERPELFARALAMTKTSLDPKGLLNPGVLID